MRKYNSSNRKQKSAKLWSDRADLLHLAIPRSEMLRLLNEEHRTFKAIYALLERDHLEIFQALDIKYQAFFALMKREGYAVTTQSAKTSTAYRRQFQFPATTPLDEIEKLSRLESRLGQEKTVKARKENGTYGLQYTAPFWESKGMTKKEAEVQAKLHGRQTSPLCVEFWLKKGKSLEDAKSEVSRIAVAGALGSLRKSHKPKTEKRLAAFLDEMGVNYRTQFKVSIPANERKYRKRVYVFDFLIEDHLIVDCHGLFWHASPEIYADDDLVPLPGRKVLARDIWAVDNHRMKIAIKAGYDYQVVWENKERKFIDEVLVKDCSN